jgi:ferric-dicitrate binding protein FerR (iron transport regulator)
MPDKPMVGKPMVDKEGEAARWFAASRRGVMLHEERAAFEEWQRDPENAARLTELQAIWRALEPQPVMPGIVEPVVRHPPAAHRRQLAAMVAFVSLTATVLSRLDGGWWNTLDWWSR